MGLFSSFRKLFSAGRTAPVSRAFDPASFLRVCQENPEEARAMLAADQSALAREIEQTFEAYDERLADLASRVHSLSPEQVRREAKNIRDAQDALRRALRRLEVSAKTAKELDRELASWEDREDVSELHADHPAFRAEVIRSELRSRGVADRKLKNSFDTGEAPEKVPELDIDETNGFIKNNATADAKDKSNALLWLTHDPAVVADEFEPEEVIEEPREALSLPEARYLLQAIREATRESERWHAIPVEDHDQEALLQVHHVRDLHAVLKRMDREQGISRNRLALAIQARETRR